MKKIFLCLWAAMLVGIINVSAQNPYPEENDPDAWTYPVKYAGERPALKDFVDASFEVGLEYGMGEVWGAVYDAWCKYKKNQKQEANVKLTVDGKNGFLRYEREYIEEDNTKSLVVVEICYWNCSDGKHKIYCENVYCIYDGKAIETENTGISFYAYNNSTRKMTHVGNDAMGVVVKTGMEDVDQSQSEYPVVTYSLPQVGKDIVATIHNKPTGKEQVILKWNGLRFE